MIKIKTKKEIAIMREGGRILARIMKELKRKVAPDVNTKDLDRAAEALIFKYGAIPAFKGYEDPSGEHNEPFPFPTALCASVNNVIVHAVPSDYKLKQGDILSLDLGIKYRGFVTDMAITVPVGKVKPEALQLIRTTKNALKLAIQQVKPGNSFGDVGNTIQKYVEGQGFGVVRELCGHGIGQELHEDPKVPNFGKKQTCPEIKQGMVFCIEPMTTMGDWRLKKSADGFGYETNDGSLSCHFEHTVAVTRDGCKILTK